MSLLWGGDLGNPPGEEAALGRVVRQLEGGLVGQRRVGAAAEAAQQVGLAAGR
jgi:hypothetical protein